MTDTTTPKIANKTVGEVKSPSATKVASSLTIIPELISPTKAMNNPIPAPTANFIFAGIAFIISSRKPVNVKIIKIIPDARTPANAVCQGIP